MVIVCEKCHTRFRLDDERIPRQGANVRCSKCKTSFFVRVPDVSDEQAVQEVVAQSTDPGAASPEYTRDLFETESGRDLGSVGESQAGDEEAWEFNEDPNPATPATSDDFDSDQLELGMAAEPDADSESGFELGSRDDFGADLDEGRVADPGEPSLGTPESPSEFSAEEAVGTPPEAAPETDDFQMEDAAGEEGFELDGLGPTVEPVRPAPVTTRAEPEEPATEDPVLDQLGSPDEWDFLGTNEAPAAAPSAIFQAAEDRVAAAPSQAIPSSNSAAIAKPRTENAGWLGMAGWALAVVLSGVGLVGALPAKAPVWSARVQPPQTTAAGTATELHGRFIENAWSGPMFLVSGQFELDPGARPVALRVRWRGVGDALLPQAGAIAGAPLAATSLRELPPDVLAKRLVSRAGWLGRGGKFQAVFEHVPPGATDFVIVSEPLPEAKRPPVPEGEGAQSQRAGSGGSEPATSPSGP